MIGANPSCFNGIRAESGVRRGPRNAKNTETALQSPSITAK